MASSNKELLNRILENVAKVEYIKPEDIPNIDLYMDQVTTFMDKRLRTKTRNPGDDKILTKTMINNYAKNDLLPAPEKKKYSKEHMLLLIFIYYYKSILSINDIQTLLRPITDEFFNKQDGFSLEDIYSEVFNMEDTQMEILKQDVLDKYTRAEETFFDAPEKDREFLQKFSFICLLSFDVYVKKLVIEKMIDDLREQSQTSGEKDKTKDKEKEKESEKKKEK